MKKHYVKFSNRVIKGRRRNHVILQMVSTARERVVNIPKITTVPEVTKNQRLPKGTLSCDGEPTTKAIVMYIIYLSETPAGWTTNRVYEPAVRKVRRYFGWDENHGFDLMIHWGMNLGCARSTTSSKRYQAMAKAYNIAKGILGQGISDYQMAS